MMKEIGGYFSLELKEQDVTLPSLNGVLLNTGRNSLEYVLRSLGNVSKLYIPYFTCSSVLEPIEKLNIQYVFYHIDINLEICDKITLQRNECLLYTNYFGIKDQYVSQLVGIFRDSLIIDNSQALYAPPTSKCIYSPRKFVGIPDGGVAFTDRTFNNLEIGSSKSFELCSHLLKRIDCSGSEAYADFRENSKKLSHLPIQKMSKLTQALLNSIDFEEIAIIRRKNFLFLHQKLGHINGFNNLLISDDFCPMVYPFYLEDDNLRSKLIEHKIYVASYWPNVLEWCKEDSLEYHLTKYIIPIPIDQRYGIEDMQYIINILNFSRQ